jgi:hypothetical protein
MLSRGWPDDWQQRKEGRGCDDPAPGGPITWDAMFTDEPTDPDLLRRQAEAIRRALSS